MPSAGSRAVFLPFKFLDLRRSRFAHWCQMGRNSHARDHTAAAVRGDDDTVPPTKLRWISMYIGDSHEAIWPPVDVTPTSPYRAKKNSTMSRQNDNNNKKFDKNAFFLGASSSSRNSYEGKWPAAKYRWRQRHLVNRHENRRFVGVGGTATIRFFCYAHCDRPRPTTARDETSRATAEWRLASRAPHLSCIIHQLPFLYYFE